MREGIPTGTPARSFEAAAAKSFHVDLQPRRRRYANLG